MRSPLDALLCRLVGRRCSVGRPASRDLVTEMRVHARRVDAQAVEMRRRREDIAATLRGRRP